MLTYSSNCLSGCLAIHSRERFCASAEAERDAKLTLDEVQDLRAGSTMIEIDNGQATLSMEVEESDDLEIWTSGSTTTLTVPANTDTKFFRFKMAE